MKTFFTATIASVLFAGIAAAGTVNFSNFTSLWEVQSGGTPVGGGFVAVGTGSDIYFCNGDLAKAGLTSNFVQFGAGTTFGDPVAAFGFDGFFSGTATADGGSADFNGKPIWLVAGTGADAATSDALLVIDSGETFGPDAPLFTKDVELNTGTVVLGTIGGVASNPAAAGAIQMAPVGGVVIPEPGVSVLALFAAGFLALRRRR